MNQNLQMLVGWLLFNGYSVTQLWMLFAQWAVPTAGGSLVSPATWWSLIHHSTGMKLDRYVLMLEVTWLCQTQKPKMTSYGTCNRKLFKAKRDPLPLWLGCTYGMEASGQWKWYGGDQTEYINKLKTGTVLQGTGCFMIRYGSGDWDFLDCATEEKRVMCEQPQREMCTSMNRCISTPPTLLRCHHHGFRTSRPTLLSAWPHLQGSHHQKPHTVLSGLFQGSQLSLLQPVWEDVPTQQCHHLPGWCWQVLDGERELCLLWIRVSTRCHLWLIDSWIWHCI